mmetsp:Transcript_11791/g.38795  ORF Transcript_11791/g.38795 Transcript_11791/m.38795 type:complete len:88 (-) Transcript_11791:281-544(-)
MMFGAPVRAAGSDAAFLGGAFFPSKSGRRRPGRGRRLRLPSSDSLDDRRRRFFLSCESSSLDSDDDPLSKDEADRASSRSRSGDGVG